MNYSDLKSFILNRMRMSHIYQPVMLLTLLQAKGGCSEEDIAKAILAHDQSQIEYYEKITRDMVGRLYPKPGEIYEIHGWQNSVWKLWKDKFVEKQIL
jgi:ATP adenylyltransferase